MNGNKHTQAVAITEPTSAYDILGWVREREHILEEHKRIRMGVWCSLKKGRDEESPYYPRCGTMACEAGWIGLRMGVNLIALYADGTGIRPVVAGERHSWTDMAVIIAGFSKEATEALHASFLGGDHFDTPDDTEEQAGAVAEYLNHFMDKWERQLKERIILPGGMVQEAHV